MMWLLPPAGSGALLDGVDAAPDHDVFGGPIRAHLEGGGPRSCGRESPPITTLDRGPADRDVELVWSANMAIRRRALERIGRFDESIRVRGDEEDWERRYIAAGRPRPLPRSRRADPSPHGCRRTPARRCRAPPTARAGPPAAMTSTSAQRPREPPSSACSLGCQWHIVRRRCANGVVMAAHAAGPPARDASSGAP